MINGATKEIGRAAVVAVTKARGMEVAGAVDTCHTGEDIGKVFAFAVISQTNSTLSSFSFTFFR